MIVMEIKCKKNYTHLHYTKIHFEMRPFVILHKNTSYLLEYVNFQTPAF
jgi:hypothetical protein